MKMEFDVNGKPIFPESLKEDLEKELNSIIFKKIQVRMSNPAIAKLKIIIGINIHNRKSILDKIAKNSKLFAERNSFVNSKITKSTDYCLIEARESYRMYSFFENLILELKKKLSGNNIVIRGMWKNWD